MNRATIYFEELSTLVPSLSVGALSGIIPRYLLRRVPNGKVPISVEGRTAAFAIGGVPLRRPEAEFHWISGGNNAATSGLCQFLKQSLKQPKLYFHPSIMETVSRHFPRDTIGEDRFFVASEIERQELEGNENIVTFNSFPNHINFEKELSEKLPPKEIWEECGFEYAALLVDGVAKCVVEYTVDDGNYCLIQQLRTADGSRESGLGKKLLGELSRVLLRHQIKPVLIISTKNGPSISLAEAVGYRATESFAVIE